MEIESAIYKSGGLINTCGVSVISDNYIEITFKTGGPVSGWATTCQDILGAPNNFIIYNSTFAQIAGGGSHESSPTGSVIQTFGSSGDGKPRVMLAFLANTHGLINGSGQASTDNRPFELKYINGLQVPGETPEIKNTPDEITVSFETSPDPIEDLSGNPGNVQVTLSWSAPEIGSSAITSYEYNIDNSATWYVSTNPAFPATSSIVTEISPGVPLVNGTEYDFMVRAVNSTNPFVAPDSNIAHVTPEIDPITDANFFAEVDVWLNTTTSPYGNISTWDVSLVTDISGAFSFVRNPNAASFNDDIGGWNTENVTLMTSMFLNASDFNKDISSWNVSLVTDMSKMFRGAEEYNNGGQPLSTGVGGWVTTSVNNMSEMFYGALKFDQLVSWDTSQVTNMNQMFSPCEYF